ncbi:MAG: hypothetical protein PHO02_06085 [Candidatus Nanoarchaeia archaeon]|nr:hypothetical protein [Candidatus Nanoarchaeia archaeon]
MPNEETRQLQNLSVKCLKRLFPSKIEHIPIEIRKEWHPFSDQKNISSPIIDVVVGPLAITTTRINEYNLLFENTRVSSFIQKVIDIHNQNLRENHIPRDVQILDDFREGGYTNPNSRSFIAIEIEGREDRKVVLADIVNVAAMGRIGIIVAKNEKVLRIFVRLLYYLYFLQKAGKPTFKTGNVIILTQQQFKNILR